MNIKYQDYTRILSVRSRIMHSLSPTDGRLKDVKRGKKYANLFGRLIILSVTFGYVAGSIWGVSQPSTEAYTNKTNLNVSPSVYQSVQNNIDKEPVKVSVTPTPTGTPTPTKQVTRAVKQNGPTKKGIYRFIKAYGGSRITTKYADQLFESCGGDVQAVSKVIGIALAETGLGRDTKKTTNFYGWYPNGNRNYDPSLETMANTMCKAVGKSGAYYNIGANKSVTTKYTGADGTAKWIERFNWAIKRMGVEK